MTINFVHYAYYSNDTILNAYELDNKANNLDKKMDDSTITIFSFYHKNCNEKQDLTSCNSINDSYKGKLLSTVEILKLSLNAINS